MFIADIKVIKQVIQKWCVKEEYLPTTIEINLKNDKRKLIDLYVCKREDYYSKKYLSFWRI